eukprot:1139891-Pelagomonas_calceolata.AAC.2
MYMRQLIIPCSSTCMCMLHHDASYAHCLQVVDLMAVDFDKVLKAAGDKLLMVDVYTQWCGPCKMIAPEIEVMAEELGDSVILSKMDCTSNNDNKKWAMGKSMEVV